MRQSKCVLFSTVDSRVEDLNFSDDIFLPQFYLKISVTGLSLYRKVVHDLSEMTKYAIMQKLLQSSYCGLGFDRQFFLKHNARAAKKKQFYLD